MSRSHTKKASHFTFSPDLALPFAYFCNEDVWYLPRRKVATSICLLPIHNILVVAFAPFLWGITIITAEPTYANRYLDQPCRRIELALPIITSRRCSRIGEPVQHDRIEHLVLAEYRLHIAIMMRPVSVFFVNPGSLCDW